MTKKIVVIGSGFSSLAAAALLAKQGHQVTVLEKNDQAGGRARTWSKDGFTFDMGPSWYWMPDVFEKFYNRFNKKTSDFYSLERLDPSYRVYFEGEKIMDIPANKQSLMALFEKTEPGSSVKLEKFLDKAGYKYKVAMEDYVNKISNSVFEYFDLKLLIGGIKMNLLSSLRNEVRQLFKNPDLISILEFPVLFLGASADKIPGMYSMMNYADLVLGTWYPKGGMTMIVKAFVKIAEREGVVIHTNHEVIKINVLDGIAKSVQTNMGTFEADVVVAGSDYNFTEQNLLDKKFRMYDEKYWQSRIMSPSSLLFYLGVNKKIPGLLHHNLFFDEDMDTHASEIYENPSWPSKPLFYVSVTSKTDDTVAPANCENLFVLIPLAPGLVDSNELREKCFHVVMDRLEKRASCNIREHIIVNRSYAMDDFTNDYHAFKGNAYGLANTLNQTAFLKPKMKSSKVSNLYFTGQLTVPGPGVPPAIISGTIAADEINKKLANGKI
ncbi:MAG: phytoene desaturase [Bacteroidia bacterium]|nr:phytoene desaturase [Bacteroidia bacterium]